MLRYDEICSVYTVCWASDLGRSYRVTVSTEATHTHTHTHPSSRPEVVEEEDGLEEASAMEPMWYQQFDEKQASNHFNPTKNPTLNLPVCRHGKMYTNTEIHGVQFLGGALS